MALGKDDIEKIARLAHLRLTDAEREKMEAQLSSVLAYVDKLAEADTEGIDALAHVTGVENVMRDDVVQDCAEDEQERIIASFPEKDDAQLKVKSVFE